MVKQGRARLKVARSVRPVAASLKFNEYAGDARALGLKLDLGAGKGANSPAGFTHVDIVPYDADVIVADLRQRWPWESGTVEEVCANYLLQYFGGEERKHFVNELHRVLRVDGRATIISPMWSAHKAYADVDIAWPPISEGWFQSLDKAHRESLNFPLTGYECDFDVTLGYGMHPMILTKNDEYQRYAVGFYKEAAQDLHVTLTKKAR